MKNAIKLVTALLLLSQLASEPAEARGGGVIGSPAGGRGSSGSGGGVIGTPAGGAIAQGEQRSAKAVESRHTGYIELRDRKTGSLLDLMSDPWATLTSAKAFRVCEELATCEVQVTEFDVDGKALALAPGRYVLELGPSQSEVIEVRDGQAVTIHLGSLARPSSIAAFHAVKIVRDLTAATAVARLKALVITGRVQGLARADLELSTTTLTLDPAFLDRGAVKTAAGNVIRLITSEDIASPLLAGNQSSVPLFAGRYAVSETTPLFFNLTDRWIRNVVVE